MAASLIDAVLSEIAPINVNSCLQTPPCKPELVCANPYPTHYSSAFRLDGGPTSEENLSYLWRSAMSCRLMFSAWVVLILSVCLGAQGVGLQITTESLPPGQQGNVYAVAFNATGGNAPYSWRISAGAAPSGIAMK